MDERRRRKLRALCEEHGIKRLAEKAGVNRANLDQILNLRPPSGRKNISSDSLDSI